MAAKQLKRPPAPLVLCGLGPAVRSVLELAGFLRCSPRDLATTGARAARGFARLVRPLPCSSSRDGEPFGRELGARPPCSAARRRPTWSDRPLPSRHHARLVLGGGAGSSRTSARATRPSSTTARSRGRPRSTRGRDPARREPGERGGPGGDRLRRPSTTASPAAPTSGSPRHDLAGRGELLAGWIATGESGGTAARMRLTTRSTAGSPRRSPRGAPRPGPRSGIRPPPARRGRHLPARPDGRAEARGDPPSAGVTGEPSTRGGSHRR